MPVPAAKVRSLCTQSETELVRASRKPELAELSPAEVKRLALRARKLFDKWQGLGRGQSRVRTRQVGLGTADANTELKVQIFRDALTSFEARLAELDGPTHSPAQKSPAKKPAGKPKAVRAVKHRAARAAVRKALTAVEDSLKRDGIKKKKSH
jgi:hypothetical protein